MSIECPQTNLHEIRCWKHVLCCHGSAWILFCWFCFAGFVLQGSCILDWIAAGQLCVLHESNLDIAMPAPPQRIPSSNHCHISLIFGGNCAGNLVCHWSEKPPWPLLAPLMAKAHQILKRRFHLDRIWQNLAVFHVLGLWVAEFGAEAGATRRFCFEKSICGPYVTISVFLWEFCATFSMVKIHLPMIRKAYLCVFSTHPKSCRHFPPLTATNSDHSSCSCR